MLAVCFVDYDKGICEGPSTSTGYWQGEFDDVKGFFCAMSPSGIFLILCDGAFECVRAKSLRHGTAYLSLASQNPIFKDKLSNPSFSRTKNNHHAIL